MDDGFEIPRALQRYALLFFFFKKEKKSGRRQPREKRQSLDGLSIKWAKAGGDCSIALGLAPIPQFSFFSINPSYLFEISQSHSSEKSHSIYRAA